MLKDGAKTLAEPISQIVNMSLGSKFGEGCKTAKNCFTSACNV